jgi:arylsulfatase A-like enzyme
VRGRQTKPAPTATLSRVELSRSIIDTFLAARIGTHRALYTGSMRTKITRRDFVGGALGAAALAAASQSLFANATDHPNILFILADDLGYGDLSCYGRPDYQTPAIDNLAKEGIKFTDNYAAAPLCTPTRCAYITGRYPQRLPVGLEEPIKKTSPDVGLPPGMPTVATQLKAAGYHTALVGKWHLGWRAKYGPNSHGFDEFFGFLSGAEDYFTHRAADAPGTGHHPPPDLYENLDPVERTGYLTDLLSDKAVEFVGQAHEPFFLSLQYNAPHSPWEGPADGALDHESHGPGPMAAGGSLKIYAAMMKSMDAGIGRVLGALKERGIERKTLVIFTSDNGGERYSFNWPFSFQKGYLWEGGTRVPAIVRWPGVVPAGRETAQAAITMDWTATILAAAGAKADPQYPLDGEDLMPVCAGTREVYDRSLFWRTSTDASARMGRWKYLSEEGKEHLFDLANDPGEKSDLRKKHPDVFEEMRKRFAAWNKQMLPRTV